MEENKKRGFGMFYAVVGVATLVVAIVGASFAYFSAVGNTTGDTITGQTNDINGATLSVNVEKVTYANAGANNGNLVPAVIDTTTTTGINKALTKKCVDGGYTGCHVWRITASTTQTVSNANLYLDMAVNSTVKTNWKYVIFKGDETASTAIQVATAAISHATTTATFTDDVDIHNNASLTSGNGNAAVYYLLVYIENTASAQNNTGATSETGTYNGTVTLAAMGGEVKTTFTS